MIYVLCVIVVLTGLEIIGYLADLFGGYRVHWAMAARDVPIFLVSLHELQKMIA